MLPSIVARYLTATCYTILEQARNRFAFFLLVIFVPAWYFFGQAFTTDAPIAFKFRVTGAFLNVSTRDLTYATLGMNAITLIVGFTLFAATRKSTEFDRRLVECGYPQFLLILAKLTSLVLISLVVSLYASLVLFFFWHPSSLPVVWISFFGASLSYGALGLLLGVLMRGELEGFFVIIMVSLIDTFIQNPLGNPVANKDFIVGFPTYAPMQLAVAGGFTHLVPGTYILYALAWPVGFAMLGLLIFSWKTRRRTVRTFARQRAQLAH